MLNIAENTYLLDLTLDLEGVCVFMCVCGGCYCNSSLCVCACVCGVCVEKKKEKKKDRVREGKRSPPCAPFAFTFPTRAEL